MTVNHEDLVATLNRLKLTTIRDKLDNFLDEASRFKSVLCLLKTFFSVLLQNKSEGRSNSKGNP